ncbi:MAG: hypothetical protein QM786_15650 [Breznakibacter sp.]
MMSMLKYYVSLALAGVSALAFAQHFKFQAGVNPVDEDGFYRIVLTPRLVGLSQPDFSDLRIFDAKNVEVPYWIDTETRRHISAQFTEYPILSRTWADSTTVLVLHNALRQRIDNLSLFIANADVQKQLRLTGSNDRQVWYSVKESDWVRPVGDGKTVAELKVVNFPLVDYEFVRIEIDDRRSSPIHVQKAGYYVSESSPGSYVPLNATWVQADSAAARTSWLSVAFDGFMVVDNVKLEVVSPALYLRQANVYAGDDEKRLDFVATVELKSDRPIDIELPSVRTAKLVLEVFNHDNPPLKISRAEAFMLKRHCVAQLTGGETYHLRFGDAKRQMPHYDIAYFRGQVPANATEIAHLGIEREADRPSPPTPWYADSRVIWGAILSVVALLGYLTWTMVKRPPQSPPTER